VSLLIRIIFPLILYIIIYFLKASLYINKDVVSNLLTIFSIFFSFLLLLVDKLTNIENLENKTFSEKKFFLKNNILVRKIKILYHYILLLLTIMLLIGILLIKEVNYNNYIVYINLTVVFVIACFISSLDIVYTIIDSNLKQIEKNINNNSSNI